MNHLCTALILACVWATCAAGQVTDLWPQHTIEDAAGSLNGADGTDLFDIDGDGDLDIVSGWEADRRVNVYFHPGAAGVRAPWPTVEVQYPLGVSDVEDSVFADLDADGRIDVITSMEGGTRRLALHWAPAAPADPFAWRTIALPAANLEHRWMRAQAGQIDGDNGLDIAAGGKEGSAGIYWFQAPAKPRELDAWRAYRVASVDWTMSLELHDMDADGDLDMLVSDRPDLVAWYENPRPGSLEVPGWTRHVVGWVQETRWLEYGDLDGDGLQDVVATVNDGEAIAIWYRRTSATGDGWMAHPLRVRDGAPARGTSKAVAIGDVNGDGRRDLVFTFVGVGNCVFWLEYASSPADPEWTAHPISWPGEMKFDNLQLVDLDGDGDLDVVTSEENYALGVIWYENPSAAIPEALLQVY